MHFAAFPTEHLDRAFRGAAAFSDRLIPYRDPLATELWYPARSDARGVLRHNPAKAQEGLTLYSSGHASKAFLIDMKGQIVHEWSLPYSKVWDSTAAIAHPLADPFIYIEKARVLPNGDLLALYASCCDTPRGYGLVKMDRNSHVLWKYLAHTHDDFWLAQDGAVYVLTQAISESDLTVGPGIAQPPKPRLDDFLVKLSPDGVVQAEMSLTAAFVSSPYGRWTTLTPADALHMAGVLNANSVEVLERPLAGIPESRKGQILVSMMNVNAIALFDMAARQVVWAQSGAWEAQHSARSLPNGHIVLFDNWGGGDASRAIEVDPATSAVVWSYGARPDQPLFSWSRSSVRPLRNGNVLIIESEAGRMIEVAPAGEVAWEYVNPVRGGAKQNLIPIINSAQRVDPQKGLDNDFRRSLGIQMTER